MKTRTPKLNEHGIAILCNQCHGEGCHDCDFEGVEMTDNDDYWEDKISNYESEGM